MTLYEMFGALFSGSIAVLLWPYSTSVLSLGASGWLVTVIVSTAAWVVVAQIGARAWSRLQRGDGVATRIVWLALGVIMATQAVLSVLALSAILRYDLLPKASPHLVSFSVLAVLATLASMGPVAVARLSLVLMLLISGPLLAFTLALGVKNVHALYLVPFASIAPGLPFSMRFAEACALGGIALPIALVLCVLAKSVHEFRRATLWSGVAALLANVSVLGLTLGGLGPVAAVSSAYPVGAMLWAVSPVILMQLAIPALALWSSFALVMGALAVWGCAYSWTRAVGRWRPGSGAVVVAAVLTVLFLMFHVEPGPWSLGWSVEEALLGAFVLVLPLARWRKALA